MQKNLKDKLIDDLSNKYALPAKQVEEAVNSQFKFVAKTIKDGKFHSVRLPYFGVFKPNMKQKQHYDNKEQKDS